MQKLTLLRGIAEVERGCPVVLVPLEIDAADIEVPLVIDQHVRHVEELPGGILGHVLETEGRDHSVGELVRVESAAEGSGLVEGAKVITDYVHFFREGDEVNVVKTVELTR